MRIVLMIAAALLAGGAASAQAAKVVARGDFDGDGRIDMVEVGSVCDLVDQIRPGDNENPKVAEARAIYAKTPLSIRAVFVRLASAPERLIMLVAADKEKIEALQIEVRPPGEYRLRGDSAATRGVLTDYIVLRHWLGDGNMVKRWLGGFSFMGEGISS